jgi:hypothetical protein
MFSLVGPAKRKRRQQQYNEIYTGWQSARCEPSERGKRRGRKERAIRKETKTKKNMKVEKTMGQHPF